MRLRTRPATASDTAFAREAHHGGYRDVVIAQFGAWDDAEQDRYFENDWRDARFDILLHDETPCGYAAVEYRADDVHVRELVIHPRWQGRGIGTAFLKGVMESAARKGLPVRLGTFHRNRALKLYQRLGFREIGRIEIHVLLEWLPK
jgi:ribosomal protein S18 acetylase RimI-like enzyme